MTLRDEGPGGGRADVIRADVILAGGGLANALIALWLAKAMPTLKVVLLEQGPALGGNHTWSFHTDDIDAAAMAVLEPLIIARWPAQEVRFPRYRRTLSTGYNTISSQNLDTVIRARVSHILTNARITELTADRVTLADGRSLTAPCVIDGRGYLTTDAINPAFQKFAGLEVETAVPHGLACPIIMDATVAQLDGYRFVYTLPLSATRLLIEDTRYSDRAELKPADLFEAIRDYAAGQGWDIARVIRQENGVLPIPLDGDAQRYWQEADSGVALSGMRALLFHAATGYSLPLAVALAARISAMPRPLSSAAVSATVREMSLANWRGQDFYRMLNRLLFLAARPDERVNVLARFYTLPEPLIRRFYAGRSTLADKARILIGKPPVDIAAALRALPAGAARSRLPPPAPRPS